MVSEALTELALFSLTVTFSATTVLIHCTKGIFASLYIHTQKRKNFFQASFFFLILFPLLKILFPHVFA